MNGSCGSSLHRHPIAVGTALLLVYGVLRAVVEARDALLFLFAGMVLASVLSFPVDWLARRMPRGLATLITLLGLLALLTGCALLLAPIVSRETARLIGQIPRAAAQIAWIWDRAATGPIAVLPDAAQNALREEVLRSLLGLVPKPFALATTAGAAAVGVVLILALAFFLVNEAFGYRADVQRLVPPRYEGVASEALRRAGDALRAWCGGILISMTIMGTLTAIGLAIAGIDNWFTLGLITFAATFVPYLGAIVSAIPGLAVALSQSPTKFAYALVVYAAVHVLEGYVVEPLIMKRAVDIRPAALLIWQIAMGAVFGLPGILAATPLLACASALVRYLYIERYLRKEPASD